MLYFLAPFIAWLVSGSLKFLINYLRFGQEAKTRIGNGGFPSTHMTIITTPAILIGLNEGWNSPIFGLAVGIMLIVAIDAIGLRNAVGKQAKELNKMRANTSAKPLRESMGHNLFEISGGAILGSLIALLIQFTLFLC